MAAAGAKAAEQTRDGGTAPGGGLSTVRNAARLLKVFRSREADLGVSELARRLGLGKSTVHRMLTTLVAEGLIEQNPRTGGYRLGIVMFELGEAVRVHMDLHAAAGPVLGELRAQTGESSQVGVLDGHEVVYVDRLESTHSLRLFTETGRRVPVHCTSSGKVLLAYLPEARRHAVLRAAPLTALTPHTITDPERLGAELARVRRRGWAEAINEREIGVASIAAPVRDVTGEVVAAISIGVPLARCSVMSLRRLAPMIVEAAEAASRRLGWSPEISVPDGSNGRKAEMPLTDVRRQGQGALRGPPDPAADRAVHRRRSRPRHGRRLRGAAAADQHAAGRRRPYRRLQGRADVQAHAADDRGRPAGLRAGARLDGLRRRRLGAGLRPSSSPSSRPRSRSCSGRRWPVPG